MDRPWAKLTVGTLSFTNRHFNCVPFRFAQLFPYCFQHADDIADTAIRVFYSHVDDAPIIRNSIKRRMDLNSAFPKFLADIVMYAPPFCGIVWISAVNLYKRSAISIAFLQETAVIFVSFIPARPGNHTAIGRKPVFYRSRSISATSFAVGGQPGAYFCASAQQFPMPGPGKLFPLHP